MVGPLLLIQIFSTRHARFHVRFPRELGGASSLHKALGSRIFVLHPPLSQPWVLEVPSPQKALVFIILSLILDRGTRILVSFLIGAKQNTQANFAE